MLSFDEKLKIPKQIVQNGFLYDLDEKFIKESLIKLRRELIKGNINFDYITTFSKDITDLNQTNNRMSDEARSSLANGQWSLSSDKKSVYYNYIAENGEFHPVMKNSFEKLTFNLLELNILKSGPLKEPKLTKELEDILGNMSLNLKE